MKKAWTFLLSAVLILGCAVAVTAHTPGINRRERHERQRIRQGVRSGELTRRETARLMAGQARIHAAERYAKADGRVTVRERRRLDSMLDRASRNIYRQKHDPQDRNP